MPCYHFIFHGHGTWMPDEDDGYVTRKDGHLPQDTQAASQYRGLMHGDELLFGDEQQRALIDEVHVAARYQQFRVHYVATEPTHIHVLVSWFDDMKPFEKLRAGIRQSLSRRLGADFGQRQWLSEGGSRRRVGSQDHFDYLVNTYLPGHGGWKWSEERGLHRESQELVARTPGPGLVPAKNTLLILAAFSRHAAALDWARQTAEEAWGPVAFVSERFEHRETTYYEATMGPDLLKCFFAFETLIDPAELAACKVTSIGWEAEYQKLGCHPEARPLNLDPGYLTEAKLVLATTKDRDHRIYLDRGIFAEVTLHFQRGAWQPRPWTYPDYQRADYHEFFLRCREFLRTHSVTRFGHG